MLSTSGVDPTHLTPTATFKFEMQVFIDTHSDYLVCKYNSDQLVEWVESRKLPPNHDNIDRAYTALKAEGKMLTSGNFHAKIAKMTHDEVQELLRVNGVAKYDDFQRFQGYDWPERWKHFPVADTTGRQTADLTPTQQEQLAKDLSRNPTKREFFGEWGPDRAKQWLIAKGYWGRELPLYLR